MKDSIVAAICTIITGTISVLVCNEKPRFMELMILYLVIVYQGNRQISNSINTDT